TAAAKAKREFEALKAEAIPALIRGLNKAAKINHSCPVLMISKKLNTLLGASTDDKLLEYARDEIGAGIKGSRHAGTLRDLRFKILMRRNALARLKPQGPAGMTTTELVRSAGRETGSKLEGVLKELEKRRGNEVLEGFVAATTSKDKKASKLGREARDRFLGKQAAMIGKKKMTDQAGEHRKAARRGPLKRT